MTVRLSLSMDKSPTATPPKGIYPNVITPTQNPHQALTGTETDSEQSNYSNAKEEETSSNASFTDISEQQDLSSNQVVQCTLGLQRIVSIKDSTSNDDKSIMSTTNETNVFGDESLKDRMEKQSPGTTSPMQGKDSCANAPQFRKIMGHALTEIDCSRHSLGYSGLVLDVAVSPCV